MGGRAKQECNKDERCRYVIGILILLSILFFSKKTLFWASALVIEVEGNCGASFYTTLYMASVDMSAGPARLCAECPRSPISLTSALWQALAGRRADIQSIEHFILHLYKVHQYYPPSWGWFLEETWITQQKNPPSLHSGNLTFKWQLQFATESKLC